MTTYTRLTIVGPAKRADLVVPDTEPLASVLPDILALLGHAPGAVALVTRTGDRLDTTQSLADQDIADGTPLWITALDLAPIPPQVADITDLTADRHGTRPDAWNPTWATVAAAPIIAVLTVLASHDLNRTQAISVLAVLALAACISGRFGKIPATVLLTAGAVGVAITTAITLPTNDDAILMVMACFGLTSAVIALVAAVGCGDRALSTGTTIGALTTAALFAMTEAGASVPTAAATTSVLGILLLGVSPGIAMTTSGLSGLDDRPVTTRDTPSDHARKTVDAAYRSLTWLVVSCTWVVATCAIAAAQPALWGRWLALASAVVLVLRMRSLPLVPQRLALVTGALAITVALVTQLALTSPGIATTATLALTILIAAAILLRPAAVVVARLHRLGDLVESAAVLALVPLLLAQWGVFTDLVGAFR